MEHSVQIVNNTYQILRGTVSQCFEIDLIPAYQLAIMKWSNILNFRPHAAFAVT